MKYVISGTDRTGSKSLQISRYIQALYQKHGEEIGLIDLAGLPKSEMDSFQYGGVLTGAWGEALDQVNNSTGLIFVIPEYNGSYPGILKLFIDYWKYPDSFEHRPMCFVGLGGNFGGLRPVEHMQQVMGYRNAYMFPQRVFLQQVWKVFDGSQFSAPLLADLLEKQVVDFQKFVKGLESQGLDPQSVLRQKLAAQPT